MKIKIHLFLSKHQQFMEYLLKISGNVHICAVKQIMVNNLEVMDDSKGQLISKKILVSSNLPKMPQFLKKNSPI